MRGGYPVGESWGCLYLAGACGCVWEVLELAMLLPGLPHVPMPALILQVSKLLPELQLMLLPVLRACLRCAVCASLCELGCEVGFASATGLFAAVSAVSWSYVPMPV